MEKANISDVAKYQKRILIMVLLTILTVISSTVLGDFIYLIILPISIASLYFSYCLAKAFGYNLAWLWAIGCAIPYVGFVVLLILNQRATKFLKENGIKVGLLGAKGKI